jgi:succinate dehydrogenase flavin-adding protein (antitoxin of CptAB toxin-antitoxin module)
MALRAGLRGAAAAWGRSTGTAWLTPAPAIAGAAIGRAAQTSTSSPFSSSAAPVNPPSSADLNALLYRARQRGFLELDILLGKWAEENAASLDGAGRSALADLLRAENPDLFSWLTGQAQPPPAVASNPVFQSIAGGVAARLAAGAPAAARAAAGVAWKRGWDDKGGSVDGSAKKV